MTALDLSECRHGSEACSLCLIEAAKWGLEMEREESALRALVRELADALKFAFQCMEDAHATFHLKAADPLGECEATACQFVVKTDADLLARARKELGE